MATATYSPSVRAARRAAVDARKAAQLAGLDAAAAREVASNAARAAYRAKQDDILDRVFGPLVKEHHPLPAHLQPKRSAMVIWDEEAAGIDPGRHRVR